MQILKIDAVIYALRSNLNTETEEGVINIYKFDDLEVTMDFVIISNPSNLHYLLFVMFWRSQLLILLKSGVENSENFSILDTVFSLNGIMI